MPGYAGAMLTRLAVLLALCAAPALADEPRAPKMPRPAAEPHVSTYGAQNATCLEWTNACQVCARTDAKSQTQCSTAGIACTPTKVTCTRP
ncbi:MAG: hypothetical protein JWN07_1873 [Hyphomicrobiales bacterium]|nr:hypothetical protein [Hyphomicrobiales bacterium]